jgi:preprotein translocase subunit SecG
MLSYLKEEKHLPASSDMPENGDATSSAQDYMTVSGHGQKVRQSTLVLVVLFGAGALGLWFMVKKSTPTAANAETGQEQTQLETALAQLSTMQNEMDSKMNAVAGRFYHFTNVDQVSVDELKKNPFKRDLSFSAGSDSNDKNNLQSQQLEQIQQEAQVIAMGLELWSITATPKGVCCMIDDSVLYVGDTYKEMKVEAIEDTTVTLMYKGIPIELKMD